MGYYYIPFLIALIGSISRDKVNKYITVYFVFIFMFLMVVLRGNTSSDYEAYQNRFSSIATINLFENFDSFALLTVFFNNFGLANFRFLLLIFGILTFIPLFFVLIKNLQYSLICLLYYYSYLFFVQPVSAMKAGVSALIFLLVVLFRAENKNKIAFFLFLLAVFFHPTSIVGIFIFSKYFNKNYNILRIIITSVIVFFLGKYFFSEVISYLANNNLGFITSKSEGYLEATENDIGTRTANIFLIVISLKFIFNLSLRYFFKKINYEDNKVRLLLNVQVFAIFIYYFCFSLPVVAARFYELIGIVEVITIAFPLLLFKEKKTIQLLIYLLIFFQFYVTVNLLGGEIVKPYYIYFL